MTPLKKLAAEIKEQTGLDIGALEPLEGGMDAAASCFRSETYFVKIRPDLPAGVVLASHLDIPGVLSPLHVVATVDGSQAIVYPRIDAANGFETPLSTSHWEEVGSILKQVHGYVGPTSFLSRETFRIHGIDTMRSSPLAHLVDVHWPEINWIIDEVQALGSLVSKQEWSFVPCHADLHVGNILTSRHTVWLVDWDTSRLAPPECDLVFFLDNGILGLHGNEEEKAFLKGYGQTTVSADLVRYYRLARLLEDLVSFAQEGDETWFMRQLESNLLRQTRLS